MLGTEPLVIFLDELPPYLEYAVAVPVGGANLGVVTTTAFANLFVAVTEMDNVCLVISDLAGTNFSVGQANLQAAFDRSVHGLREYQLVDCLQRPGRDLSTFKANVVDKLATRAWYLHNSADGRLYFKNQQNLAAKLRSTAQSLHAETVDRMLREHLGERQNKNYQLDANPLRPFRPTLPGGE